MFSTENNSEKERKPPMRNKSYLSQQISKNNAYAQKCNQISVVSAQGIHNLFVPLTIF